MSDNYTKLASSIIHSTIWREADHVRIVWVTMLALVDKHGLVEASIPGLADAARVTVEQCEEALEKLMAPDPYSRTPDHDGRRIDAVEGGWELLNHAKYRGLMTEEQRREKDAERARRYRERQKSKREASRDDVTDRDGCDESRESLHTDTDPNTDPNKKNGESRSRSSIRDSEIEAQVDEVLAYFAETLWPKAHNGKPRGKQEHRRKPIRARLRDGYTVAEIKSVFDRVGASPFHLGKNDTGKAFIEPESVLGPKKIDGWLSKPVPKGAGINAQPSHGVDGRQYLE